MFRHALLVLTIYFSFSEGVKKQRYEDPFSILDQHISHTLAHQYLWPWGQLVQAAAAIEAQENLERPKIVSDDKKVEFNIYAKRFKPEDLRVRVKNQYIIVEGKNREENEDYQFMANHFNQRFILPRGSKPEEVTAVLNENGVLTVSVPKHELPPERIVPIDVKLREEKTEKPEEIVQESETVPPVTTTPSTATEQLELTEATTHIGKIRKKELKPAKETKDNEVTKGVEGNGLDYALVDPDE